MQLLDSVRESGDRLGLITRGREVRVLARSYTHREGPMIHRPAGALARLGRQSPTARSRGGAEPRSISAHG